ncbi:MAG: EAL domain-containing protein [Acidimicrobiales bacterium]
MAQLTAEPTITQTHLEDVLRRGMRSVYQPIVDLGRAEIAGYEALTRFEHPEIHCGPDRWFAAAAQFGMETALDAAALRCAFANRGSLPPGCFLTVNVEPSSLTAPRVRQVLQRQKNLTGVVVEITEHRAYDIETVKPALDQIRRSGAQLAMDDAGSGHSGLQQILSLRPEVLKLDRSLVSGIDQDEPKKAMVEMLRFLSARLGSKLLAEGVETRAEAEELSSLQVPLAQGYYFARPAEPFATLPDDIAFAMRDRRPRGDGHSLHRLCAPHPALPARSPELGQLVAASGRRFVALIDSAGRPIGLAEAVESTGPGEPSGPGHRRVDAVIVPASTKPADLGARLSTSSVDLSRPVIITDNGGHYLGLLPIRRLLADLAQPSSDTDGEASGVA